MNRKYLWIFVFAFILLGAITTVTADQDGYDRWCNSDQYGCWVTDEDGRRAYIMFWSEESRQFFMGPRSDPYELVVQYPGFNGRFPLESGITKYVKPTIPASAATADPTSVPVSDPTEESTSVPISAPTE